MNPGEEKKLKDFTDRLMAMSPEPPPFPEETVVTNPENQPRRISPLLVFAGAAAAVLLAIGIPFLFFDNGPPVAAPDTTTSTTSTTVEQATTTTTTIPDTTTTTSDGEIPIAGDAIVYLVQSPENSFTGNPALVAFATPAYGGPETDLTLYALQILAPVDIPLTAPDGFFNAVPEGVEVYGARVADGAPNAIILEMNETFLEGSGTGLLGDVTMLNQLIYTATQDPGIDEVQFIVNNQPVTEFGTEGIDLSGSVNRETFRDEIALINVTYPILLDQDGTVVVAGISNTFEAAMTLRITDAEGNIRHEENTTATSGSGTWGTYEFVLDASLLADDSTVQVFEYSAKDGTPQNIISIRYNSGLPWDFSGGFTN
jgi:Immunoglobulin-like domain of bacterial spore germination/Sporulation and spore germination